MLVLVMNTDHSQSQYNIVSSLFGRCQNKPPMEFLDPFIQMSKSDFRLKW